MDKLSSERICQLLTDSVCAITVVEDGEVISHGTGFVISHEGQIVTAAHVVTGRVPIRSEDINAAGTSMTCQFRDSPPIEYEAKICGIQLKVEGFRENVLIDLAILEPRTPPEYEFKPLARKREGPHLGQQLYMAGFSDEVELPFKLDALLNPSKPGAAQFLHHVERGYQAVMGQLMCKGAMVGNNLRFFATAGTRKIEGNVFYLDKAMHSGASGGPVVDEGGAVVGVITHRAVTSVYREVERIEIPSGSALAVSLEPLNTVDTNQYI